MTSNETGHVGRLSREEIERLEAIKTAGSLDELRGIMDAPSDHEAYLEAKAEWRTLLGRQLQPPPHTDGLPGDTIEIEGQAFIVHGITHAGTDAERTFLRERVSSFLDAGDRIYCEQGIRSMYFHDFESVCEMDDYRWAVKKCQELDITSSIDEYVDTEEESIGEDIATIASQFRELAFGLIESGSELYGDRFAVALGDVASEFLMRPEQMATVDDFASFRLSRKAAADPTRLADLQHYYRLAFLPQPLEREWLRRHDRELEIFTHARNERMSSYALYHGQNSAPVHLIVGAAHQPGVLYYLDNYRGSSDDLDAFEPVP